MDGAACPSRAAQTHEALMCPSLSESPHNFPLTRTTLTRGNRQAPPPQMALFRISKAEAFCGRMNRRFGFTRLHI